MRTYWCRCCPAGGSPSFGKLPTFAGLCGCINNDSWNSCCCMKYTPLPAFGTPCSYLLPNSTVLICDETSSGTTEEKRCSRTRAVGAEGVGEANSGISKTAVCRGTSNAPMFGLDDDIVVPRYAATFKLAWMGGWMDGSGRRSYLRRMCFSQVRWAYSYSKLEEI